MSCPKCHNYELNLEHSELDRTYKYPHFRDTEKLVNLSKVLSDSQYFNTGHLLYFKMYIRSAVKLKNVNHKI